MNGCGRLGVIKDGHILDGGNGLCVAVLGYVLGVAVFGDHGCCGLRAGRAALVPFNSNDEGAPYFLTLLVDDGYA